MDIQIENLTKSYGPQIAVNNINLSVKTGEILGFLGPNGAGKSTTMKMITGYTGIQYGTIKIGGKSVGKSNEDIKKHIGYLPENNPLYLDMPIIDYLQFCGELQGLNKDNLSKRIKEMISLCGLNREKHKKIGELSKGYRQRVGLAQSMIHDPEILILDEPTRGVDVGVKSEMYEIINKLAEEGTAIILISSELPEILSLSHRIIVMREGKITKILNNKEATQEKIMSYAIN